MEPAGIRRGGWLDVQPDDSGCEVRVRLRGREGGRLEIVEMRIADPTGLTGTSLRDIPLGQLEALANCPELAQSIRDAMRGVTLTHFPISTMEQPPIRLDVPSGRKRKPDDFYRAVAAAYRWLSHQSPRPAEEIATRNDVPVTTVHRWVKEARHRGFAVPGRRRRSRRGLPGSKYDDI